MQKPMYYTGRPMYMAGVQTGADPSSRADPVSQDPPLLGLPQILVA